MTVWSWDLLGNAFGTAAANDDADEDGESVSFGLRFPGQQYDAATGLRYNYFRDYDPATGRYVESDPIGLGGGLSTFGYVSSAPMLNFDRYGLKVECKTGWQKDEFGIYSVRYDCKWSQDPLPTPKLADSYDDCFARCDSAMSFCTLAMDVLPQASTGVCTLFGLGGIVGMGAGGLCGAYQTTIDAQRMQCWL